jgi:hypothetical protein
VNTYYSASSTHRISLKKKTKISIFGGISKFLNLIVFGQILANFGNFGQIWADFATLAVADSMPEVWLKS